MQNLALLSHLDALLQPAAVRDYCPNGLQVQGSAEISHLVCGVTASEALIDEAIARGASALFVHHGYFWKGEDPCIRGMKHRRLAKLLKHDINLFAYHLPLDIHPELGNNAQLAKLLGIAVDEGLEPGNPVSVAMRGHLETPVSLNTMAERISDQLGRVPMVEDVRNKPVKTVAWCTGGGQNYIDLAAEQGIDLFITGEVSEKTIHTAREMHIDFIAAGHHATERYGAKAVCEHLAQTLGLSCEFVDIDNPA